MALAGDQHDIVDGGLAQRTGDGLGAGAAGAKGYPNLLDNDWLWGGDMASIHTTLLHGIRNTTDADARYSQMPSFGKDGILDKDQIGQVVNFVRQISGQDHDAALATAGATVFADNCSACHGPEGKGDRNFGAPNLTDAIWLYGGDEATLTDWTMPLASRGLLRGEALARYVRQAVGGRLIEQMALPLGILATDLGNGQGVLFRRGDAAQAVRASSAVPGVFAPVHIAGRDYVDGGLVAPVPVRYARDMGAEVVKAVLSAPGKSLAKIRMKIRTTPTSTPRMVAVRETRSSSQWTQCTSFSASKK